MPTYINARSVNVKTNIFSNNKDIVSIDCNNTPWTDNSMHQAFNNCTNLQAVSNIPNSITNMYRAFYNCQNLTNVGDITSNSITNIQQTFYNCKKLTDTPNLPNSITNMSSTFYNCTSLINALTIPNSVTDMNITFSECANLEHVIIPNSVVNMDRVFSGCKKLFGENKYPDIPQSVQTIHGMYSNMNDTATTVPQWCLNKWNNCSSNVKKTMSGMFIRWTNLTTAPTIPDGVESIAEMFYLCNNLNLKTVNIPNTVTNMHATFNFCDGNGGGITRFPNNVQDISYCFYDNTYLTSCPTIPNSVVNMAYTFWDCVDLATSPTIPNNVINLDHTFQHCFRMSSMPSVIPNGVVHMNSTFQQCWNVPGTVHIPKSVEYMRETFNYCYDVPNVYIESENVKSAIDCFKLPTSGSFNPKNVYIPFKYTNGEYTKTYNSFTSAGYKTDGSYDKVYLKDINAN